MSQETQRSFAVVKWFNPKAGYGFLTDVDSNADVFVHHNGIKSSDNVYKTLTTGEYVEYSTTEDDSGKTLAVDVTGQEAVNFANNQTRPVKATNAPAKGKAPSRKPRGQGKSRPRTQSSEGAVEQSS